MIPACEDPALVRVYTIIIVTLLGLLFLSGLYFYRHIGNYIEKEATAVSKLGYMVLSGLKLIPIMPVLAIIWFIVHLGGIGVNYPMGKCAPLLLFSNLNFYNIPVLSLIITWFLDLGLYRLQNRRNLNKALYFLMHCFIATIPPIVLTIFLMVLEYQVRQPY